MALTASQAWCCRLDSSEFSRGKWALFQQAPLGGCATVGVLAHIGMHTCAYKYRQKQCAYSQGLFLPLVNTSMHCFIDGKTIHKFLDNIKHFLFQHIAVLLDFQNWYHNASSNLRAGKTRIYIEHTYLCENVCGRCIHKSISIYSYVHTYKNSTCDTGITFVYWSLPSGRGAQWEFCFLFSSPEDKLLSKDQLWHTVSLAECVTGPLDIVSVSPAGSLLRLVAAILA